MKKKFIKIAVAAVVVAAAGYGVYASKSNNGIEFTDLMLENIQALAVDETDHSEYCEKLCLPDNAHFCYIETKSAYIYCMNKYPKGF